MTNDRVDPVAPSVLAPRLAVLLYVSALTDGAGWSARADRPASLRERFDACVREVDRLGGSFDPSVDVFADYEPSRSQRAAVGLQPAVRRLLDRVSASAYDGVVVFDMPSAFRRVGPSFQVRRVLIENRCDVHVVGLPQVSVFGPSSVFFDLYALEGDSACRARDGLGS